MEIEGQRVSKGFLLFPHVFRQVLLLLPSNSCRFRIRPCNEALRVLGSRTPTGLLVPNQAVRVKVLMISNNMDVLLVYGVLKVVEA